MLTKRGTAEGQRQHEKPSGGGRSVLNFEGWLGLRHPNHGRRKWGGEVNARVGLSVEPSRTLGWWLLLPKSGLMA